MTMKFDKRVQMAGRFIDNTFYLQYLRYFDILAQVHSVVETRYGTWVLRIWRAQRFGPEKYVQSREERFFRVTQEYFNKYIVAPDPRIAKAIEVYGKEMMMEIEVYDEHRDMLEALRSGDFVAVINVHYARGGIFDSLKLHGGSCYNRGINKVPENHTDSKFQSLKRKVERALDEITDYEEFGEFVDQSKTASMQSAGSSTSTSASSVVVAPAIAAPQKSSSLTNQNQPIAKKYRSFAAASSDGKLSFAQPCSKIIIGDLIAVDWFGKRDARKYHFLTHAHTDHCRNLDRRWGQKVYCSRKTGLILPQVMGYDNYRAVPPGIIHPLEENIAHQFDGFTVTLIDANHCPGSVMCVFEGPAIPGERVLCTGDFRADAALMKLLEPEQKLHWITKMKFSTVYLDNTYFSLNLSFPNRDAAFFELFEGVQAHKGKNIYIPVHRLGREEMLEELSRQMMEPVMAYEEKKTMACTMSYFFEFGIKNEVRTIRVVKRNKWQLVEGEDHLDFVIFDVSMLHHMTTSDPMIEMHKERVIRIPYSDHSSREETVNFLKCLCFSSIVPCSKRATQKDLELMLACSNDKDASLTACEEKLVIDSEDDAEEANGRPEAHGKTKEDEQQRREEMEMEAIVEKTKDLDVDQRSPSEPQESPPPQEEGVQLVPAEEAAIDDDDDDDLAQFAMKEVTMEATLEAMVESTTLQGIMAAEEDEEPGPSHDHHENHLNLELDMDLNLSLGLNLPPTPAPPTPTFNRNKHHSRHNNHHHYSSHYPGSLEIDDVSMVVQQADEEHRNLRMRLNSPEEPPLETLHLNRWNEKTPEPSAAMFSPLYQQEVVPTINGAPQINGIKDEKKVVERKSSSLEPIVTPKNGHEEDVEDLESIHESVLESESISESEKELEPEEELEQEPEPEMEPVQEMDPEQEMEPEPLAQAEPEPEQLVVQKKHEQPEEKQESKQLQNNNYDSKESTRRASVSSRRSRFYSAKSSVGDEEASVQQPTTSAAFEETEDVFVSSPRSPTPISPASPVEVKRNPIARAEIYQTVVRMPSEPPEKILEDEEEEEEEKEPEEEAHAAEELEAEQQDEVEDHEKEEEEHKKKESETEEPEHVEPEQEEPDEEEPEKEYVQKNVEVLTNGHKDEEKEKEEEEEEEKENENATKPDDVEDDERMEYDDLETEPELSQDEIQDTVEVWPTTKKVVAAMEVEDPEDPDDVVLESPKYVEPEAVVPEEEEKEEEKEDDDDDDDEEEEELERNLDLWKEGPPKTLKEAIARLQQRPPASRRRQRAQ